MKRQRLLAIGLDGLDVTLAERLMAEGQMPALAQLKKRAARFPLDEGHDRRSGLPWEHIASGLSSEAAGRYGPVEFDPATYTAWQDGAHLAPWWAKTDLRVVVFDTPFVDLRRARNTQGIVDWGSHDPGSDASSRPSTLRQEFTLRFGDYPATEWLYAMPWPSATRSCLMGEALSQALEVRTRAAQWLAAERFHDWDLFFTVSGELHSAAEGLWHGVDARHPLHTHPSAKPAAAALLDVYRALDRMVGELANAAGDAAVLAFNMGGMGPNESDVQSMVLLPELLYRHAFGSSLLTVPREWLAHPDRVPMLGEDETFETVWGSWIPDPAPPQVQPVADAPRRASISSRFPAPIGALLKGARIAAKDWRTRNVPPNRLELDYMPSYRYRNHWPLMPAFALPSFLDGRIRINLRGRERDGIVELSQHDETCRSIETLLRECRDPRTGEPSVAGIERPSIANPMNLANSDSDLLVVWRNVSAALEHPRLGLIGPVPLRRTGGHSLNGVAYLAATGLQPGDREVRSSADLAPTIIELLGAKVATPISGKSFLSAPVTTRVSELALTSR